MQLPLPVSLPTDETFDSFVSGGNEELVAVLTNLAHHLPLSPGDQQNDLLHLSLPLVNIVGGAARGKSHLLYAICHQLANQSVPHLYLNLNEFADWVPSIFDGLELLPLVCLDNIDAIASNPQWEEALFDFLNRVGESKTCAVVSTSRLGPQHPLFTLPDLRSRLGWGVTYHLHYLDDDQRQAALTYRAKQQGLLFSDTAIQFLINHCDRDMRSLMDLLGRLDKRSLQEQKRLTVPMVKRELGIDDNPQSTDGN